MSSPFFSIIIATYNSERTLRYTLQSIRDQVFDKKELEVIVVDGGSEDDTVKIAEEFGAMISDNSKRLPEYAKSIGTGRASGRYIIRMDSDEEFDYPFQLRDKMEFLKKYPQVKMLINNRIITGRKELCGISGSYMNTLGDPFTYFIYRTKRDRIITNSDRIVEKSCKGVIMRFNPGDIYPIADSGTCVLSLEYMKQNWPNEYDSIGFICSAYDRVLEKSGGICGVLYTDQVRHNCASSFAVYLSKLRFRVINNIFHKEESGFSSKEKMNPLFYRRKYLFVLYSLLFPLPLMDSIRLAVTYRDASFLLHFVYLYYVCFQIFIMLIFKITGREFSNKSYG